MANKDEIFQKISGLIVELFEISPSEIKLESRLNEDLGLDSIDAIDLIGELQGFVGKRLKPEDFKSVRTVADIIKVAEDILSENQKEEV